MQVYNKYSQQMVETLRQLATKASMYPRRPFSILDLSFQNSFLHNFIKMDKPIKVNKATYD